jgi:phosphate transport system substrate-binding protein
MMKIYFLAIGFVLALCVSSCNDQQAPDKDNQTSGSILISVDETYKPVMEEQIKIFLSNYPKAKVTAQYKSEADCVKDFINDTVRMVFIGRPFTETEKQLCKAKKFLVTRELPLARDAVAFITAKGSKAEYTQTQFENLLQGKLENREIVFDQEGSSTYTYVVDSILKGRALSKNVFGAKGGQDVIDHIAENTNSIGAIGVSWVSDKNDPNATNFLKKVEVVGILPFSDSFVRYRKPYAAYIGNQEYPYCRNLYFASKESWNGLGMGFANFLCRDGQLVFAKSNLFPLQQNVLLRPVIVTN